METAFLSVKEFWMKTGKDSSILVNIDLVNYNLWYLVNALLPRRLYFDLDLNKLSMVILKVYFEYFIYSITEFNSDFRNMFSWNIGMLGRDTQLCEAYEFHSQLSFLDVASTYFLSFQYPPQDFAFLPP